MAAGTRSARCSDTEQRWTVEVAISAAKGLCRRRPCRYRLRLLRCEGGDDFFETWITAQRVPKRNQFQLPITRGAGTADGGRKLFTGEIFVTDPCSDHREILNHSGAIDRVFFRWQQLYCASAFLQRLFFPPKSGVD